MPVRKVSNRGGNAIGRFPSTKMGRMIAFESLLERDFIYLLDYDPAVEWFEEQPLSIEYVHETKLLHYTPDFHLLERGRHVLVECKPERFVETEENLRKFAVAQAWCEETRWEFRVVTDQQVRNGYRLQNVKLLAQYARQKVDVITHQIQAFLRGRRCLSCIHDLAQAILPAILRRHRQYLLPGLPARHRAFRLMMPPSPALPPCRCSQPKEVVQ